MKMQCIILGELFKLRDIKIVITRKKAKKKVTESLTWTRADITHFKIRTAPISSLVTIQTRDTTACATGFIQLHINQG